MISAIITAAGRNRRMEKDQRSLGIEIQNKLLLDLHGKPVIIRSLENVLNTDVTESTIVLGYFNKEVTAVLKEYVDVENIEIIVNTKIDVELSETLLNGVNNIREGLCLCVAADQPTVSSKSLQELIDKALEYPDPGNIVSILARKDKGYLNSTEGLGMPFVCHSSLLKKYLPNRHDNLNPILGDMLDDGVIFYGVNPRDELELTNINYWDDYLTVRKLFK